MLTRAGLLLPRRHVVLHLCRAHGARVHVRAAPPHPPRQQSPPLPEPIDPSQPLGDLTTSPTAPTRPSSSFAPWIIGALAAGIGFYTLQLYLAATAPCMHPHIADLAQQKDVAARYDSTASDFDSEVGLSEFLMGINSRRKELAQACRGDVLEVSCGTGRNLGYHDIIGEGAKVESLAFLDLSPAMVDVCRRKWATLYGSRTASLKPGLSVRFMTADALSAMPLAPSGKKYTTILQTMGLCSTAHPTQLLTNMVAHLDLTNPDSRILLLEHGRSYLPWLNRILDNSAQRHAELHGCWFNREIGTLVEEAAAGAGMEVVRERRHHGGTTWVMELRPTAETIRKAAAAAGESSSMGEKAVVEKSTSWWGTT
ncbi:hypothetical protein LTR53_015062 [Teratosphaeriaceae sp. CCFEE 6253]|nr:hypothetical protein LTR53_015062 [Teratosphaeriaceae sp. CCFEE 6253]